LIFTVVVYCSCWQWCWSFSPFVCCLWICESLHPLKMTATIPPPSAIVDGNWESFLSDPVIIVPVTCTLILAVGIVSIVIFLAQRNCSPESMLQTSRSEQNLGFHESHCESPGDNW
jgi:hypothetical protein